MAQESYHITATLEANAKGFESAFSSAERAVSNFESNAGGGMDNFQSKFGKAVSGIGGMAGKIGNVMTVASTAILAGTAAAGAGLVKMGMSAIDSAADMAVVEAQYKQVFTGIEGAAGKALDGMSEQWNIVPQRLQEPMSAFQSFFKSVGKDGTAALDSTSKAMQIAADSSAFYDKSLEDTSASLKGFLMGNYENGDALGVNTNLTKIAKAYNDEYGGSFQDLADAAQQDFLLEYIGSVQKASGVTGQAAREQDNWANVVGNAQQKFENFKASIGEQFLPALTKGLQALGPVFDAVGDKVTAFFESAKGQEVIKQFGDTVQMLGDKLLSLVQNVDIGAITDQIGQFITSFTNGDLAGTISGWIDSLVSFGTQVAQILPILIQWAPTILKVAIALKGLSFIATLVPLITGIGSAISGVVGFFGGFSAILASVGGAIGTVATVIGGALTAIAAFLGLPVIAVAALAAAIGVAVAFIITHWEQTKEVVGNVCESIGSFFSGLGDTIGSIAGSIGEWFSGIGRWAGDMASSVGSFFSSMASKVSGVVSGMVSSVTGFFSNLFSSIGNIVGNIVNSISNGFNNAKNTAMNITRSIVSGVVSTFKNIVSGISSTVGNITSTISNGLSNALSSVLDFGSKFFDAGANIVGMIADGISGAVGKVTGAIGDITQKIRNFLPFSPAKEGPLRDIHKLNFGGTISQGIYHGEREISRAMDSVMDLDALNNVGTMSLGAQVGRSFDGMFKGELQGSSQTIQTVVNLDGQTIAVASAPYQQKELDSLDNRNNRLYGI